MNAKQLSRRSLLAGVPAVAAVGVRSIATALSGLPTGHDPVFELIERHRQAVLVEYASMKEVLRLEEIIPDERQTWRIYFGSDEEPPENCSDDPLWIEANVAHIDATYEKTDLLLELLTTAPSTLAGVTALLDHMAEPSAPDIEPGEDTHLEYAGNCWREDLNEAAAAFLSMISGALRKLLAA